MLSRIVVFSQYSSQQSEWFAVEGGIFCTCNCQYGRIVNVSENFKREHLFRVGLYNLYLCSLIHKYEHSIFLVDKKVKEKNIYTRSYKRRFSQGKQNNTSWLCFDCKFVHHSKHLIFKNMIFQIQQYNKKGQMSFTLSTPTWLNHIFLNKDHNSIIHNNW